MVKGLTLFFMLAFTACAASVNHEDLLVTCPNGVSFYKKDYAPLDFPNEIFAEYGCKRSRVYHFDLDSDGLNDIVLNVYYDKNDIAEAWWFLRILDDEKSKTTSWAFLKNIDGKAKIIWKNKRLEKQQKEWLQGIIQSIDEALAAQ